LYRRRFVRIARRIRAFNQDLLKLNKEIRMARRMTGLAVIVVLSLTLGCGKGAPPKPALVDVAGNVQIDGNPVPLGEISLMVSGQAPVVLPIKDGKFSGKAMVGENLVRLYAHRVGKPIMMNGTPVGEPVKENYADEQYNEKSTATVKIEAAGSKTLKFDIQAKPEAPAAS
jgi:hypothetical protein